MAKADEVRKSRFRKALRRADMTAAAFAATLGITPGHLSQVLSGKRESLTLATKIDGFTKRYLDRQKATV